MSGPVDPATGPQILFFSGGTALRGVSRSLTRWTWRSVHLVTSFDSGGSSAVLRDAFGAIAVGDLRNRLLALADQDAPGFIAKAALVGRRMSLQAQPERLDASLRDIAEGRSPELKAMPADVAAAAQRDMTRFLQARPESLDLRGASVGNLLLIGAWLNAGRDLHAALDAWAALLGARGRVLPITTTPAHLRFTLQDGSVVKGQHLVSGKHGPSPQVPIASMDMVCAMDSDEPTRVQALPTVVELIRTADLICYPMGSFYSSVLANLMPEGVVEAVASARCPKIFLPNTGADPEQRGLSVAAAAARLTEFATERHPQVRRDDILDTVVFDGERGQYTEGVDVQRLHSMGLRVLDMPLVTEGSAPRYEPERVAALLYRLARARPSYAAEGAKAMGR